MIALYLLTLTYSKLSTCYMRLIIEPKYKYSGTVYMYIYLYVSDDGCFGTVRFEVSNVNCLLTLSHLVYYPPHH